MVDPRMSVINHRLERIKRIIAVSSGKGGVGKSLVATALALSLVEKGCKVGLFDLDFTSPSTHVLLGAKGLQPTEEKGLIPPVVNGLEYMSLIYYSSGQAAPLRGVDTSNALIELFAVTLWNDLDFLVLDMPPGIGDAVLDLIRLVSRIEFLIVTTSSQLAFETVKKLVSLLQNQNVHVVGIVENMKLLDSPRVHQQTEIMGLKFLGEIPFDSSIEEAIGNPKKLLQTELGRRIGNIAQML